MIKVWRDELECRRLPAEEGRNLRRRLPRRALTVAGPEPPAGRVPDAIACPFLKTICRDLCDLIENEPTLHQNAKVLLKMLLFAAAFRMAEAGVPCFHATLWVGFMARLGSTKPICYGLVLTGD